METYIIGEIGINHNGDLNIAKELIRRAKENGFNAVKFQKRTIEEVYSKNFLDSYRKSPWGDTQRDQKEGLEFSKEEYEQIDNYCKQIGIDWFASAWDVKSQLFLRQFSLKYNKVASAMLTNIDLLKVIAEERKTTFISTGLSTEEEIDNAIKIFKEAKCPFVLMHCTSTYPLEEENVNLNVIDYYREKYHCPVGYSGHENGVLVSMLAVAHNAEAIEKHITLDKTMYGSDQKSSIENDEMKELVTLIRKAEIINGSNKKSLSSQELEVRKKLRGY